MADPIVLPAAEHPGLVLAPGPHGRCDDRRVGGAVVDHDAASGQWRMWYYCRDEAYDRPAPATLGSGRIALATSADGIRWDRVDGDEAHGAVMAPDDAAGRFDGGHIGLTDVTRDGAGWRMWYFGGDERVVRTGIDWLGDVPGFALRCGTAHSGDGLRWERTPGATPSGALFEILDDERYAAWPNAIVLPGRTLLQYTAPTLDLSEYRTRVVAIGADGVERLGPLQWADAACEYDVGGVVTRHVVPDPRAGRTGWLMAYTALDAHHGRSIGLAESVDGLAWRRVPGGPILRPGDAGRWDDCGVAANRLVIAEGRVHLYYYGFRSLTATDAPRGIGLAIADLAEPWTFRRVEAAELFA